MHRASGILLGAAILLAACNGAEEVGGSEADAMAIAGSFLAALEARDDDLAWSLVYPGNRARFFDNDRAAFDALVERIHLEDAAWQVVSAGDHDGHYHVKVRFDQPPIVDDALGVFVDVVPGTEPGTVDMQVDIEPLGGDRGVLGG